MSSQSVVVYQVGPMWRPDLPLQEQEQALGHIRFIRGLLDDGVAQLAGPFTRLDERVTGEAVGMILFDVPVDTALSMVAKDPAVQFGLLVPKGHAFYRA